MTSRLQHFQDALRALADSAVAAGDLSDAAKRITALAVESLNSDRAAFWVLEGDDLICIAELPRANASVQALAPLTSAQHPRYVAHLAEQRVLVSDDARRDSRVTELHDSYLAPNRVGALMHAPIRVRGELSGIICAECCEAHVWSEADASLIGSLADFASLALAAQRQSRTEEMLQQRQLQLDLILSHADAVIFTLNRQGEFSYISPAVRQFTDERPEQVVGSSWQQVAHPDDQHKLLKVGVALFTGETEREQIEFRVPDAQGGWRWLSATATLMRGSDGRRQVVAISQDVTEIKRQREQHAALTRRLQETQRLEAIGRLAGGVAHDFNNLLTIILGGIDLVAIRAKDQGLDRVLDSVRDSAERAARLTQQLLAFSRRQPLEIQRVDISEVLSGIARLLHSLLRDSIQLRIEGLNRAFHVVADRGQLEQIVLNLVINSVEAMPNGGTITIEIGQRQVTHASPPIPDVPAGNYVHLMIRDTGLGMDAATRARIFEPFFTSKPIEQGAGLGLSAVFGIIHQHNGYIDVESEPGSGTTFHILLPHAADTAAAQPIVDAAPESARRAARILVVEDEDTLRELTVFALKRAGFDAEEARNGREALQRIQSEHSYDLLITDVVMPDLNGINLYQHITSEHPALPVLFISGYASEAIPAVLETSARTAFLQKPFTIAALTERVRGLLTA